MSLLPKPILNPNAPGWVKEYAAIQQDHMDWQYLHGPAVNSVDAYETAAKAWIANQSQLRAASADPENYKPEPFTRPLPVREIFDTDDSGTVFAGRPPRPEELPPPVHPPVLPPYVKPVTTPNAGFVSTAGQAKAQEDAKFAAQMALLSQINGKLDKLLSK